MNHELAKKLRDAGLKVKHNPDFCVHNGCTFNEDYIEKPDITHFPTLSELIEACGDRFASLHLLLDGEWQALAYMVEFSSIVPEGIGNSSEEAVANLWLALNKK